MHEFVRSYYCQVFLHEKLLPLFEHNASATYQSFMNVHVSVSVCIQYFVSYHNQ